MTRAKGVASGINQVTDYFKQQGEKKKLIKQSDVQIDAALKLFPDLSPTLQGVRDQIKDENISLNERAQIAETVAGLINMGTNQMQAMAIAGLKKRELDIQEGKGIQEALARQAKEKESNWTRFDEEIVINGKPVRVIGSGDQFGRFKDLKNNIYPSVFDAFSPPLTQPLTPPDGVPTPDLPLGKNSATPPNDGVPLGKSQSNNVPSLTRDLQNLADQEGASAANDVRVDLPFGSSVVTPKEKKPTREAKVVSGNEAEALGLPPTGTYEVTYENGKPVGYKPITAPKAEKEIDVKDKESALRAAGDAAYAITTINALTSSPGFSGVFGAKAGSKFFPGTKARNAESLRKAIVALATTDSIKKFQGLGSMSNSEFAVAQSAATRLEDSLISDEEAAEELNRLRSYFAESIRRAENLGKIPKGSADKMITDAMANLAKPESPTTKKTVTPKTATDQLRAMQK
jgi:hypothetical protein